MRILFLLFILISSSSCRKFLWDNPNDSLNAGKEPAILKEGLVAYYPFNANANDESENGNNGQVKGARLTDDRFGNSLRAFDFSSSGSLIQAFLDDNESPSASENYTIFLWFRRDNPSVSSTIIMQYKDGQGVADLSASNYDIIHSHDFCEKGRIAIQNYPFNN
jgi:hypothetical protein